MKHLILAGIYDSGPQHWQSIWMRDTPGLLKLDHASWTHPDRYEWVHELDAKIDTLKDEVVLVAHSLACLLVAHWAGHANGRVHGALLVSVPDPDNAHYPPDAKNFGNPPMERFPFRSVVVSSDNDPYGSQEYMKRCADAWGSEFVAVSGHGHINADSGLGGWKQGKEILRRVTG